ncbi:hypothetical protein SK128_028316 [Halocaridina rubra]|uniref:Protein zwilch n=1 Tax=Halocaridina rubra TaxID=373956 RepID=A0AAN8XKD1_HALRR
MSEKPEAGSISDILTRLLRSKNTEGEYISLCGEQLIITREECPEVLARVNKTPDIILVQQMTKHNKKLLSVEDRAHIEKELKSSTPAQNKIPSDDFDITGSPLKCPFSVNGAFSELSPMNISLPSCKKKRTRNTISCFPISTSKACMVAMRFNLALKTLENATERLPLWVVCDGKDAQGTHFYGVHHNGDSYSRIVVTASGPYDNFDVLTLDHLKAHHIVACATKRVESAVKATYTVLASEDENANSGLELTCSWKRILEILTPPTLDADTNACLKIVCSDKRSTAHQMYQELMVLCGFVNGLSTGEVSWFIREDSQSVSEDLEKVFTTIRDKAQRQKRDEEGTTNFDMMVQDKFYDQRHNMDFTDLLWNVLMRCESYSDLKQNLHLVFITIAYGQVRPQIHVRNKTQIGILARGLMRGQEELPDLSGVIPLQMLIEIGIEKIKRDYINIFQAGELVTGDQLLWFVNNEDESFENMISLLQKLHVGLQVCILLHTYLNLPPASLAHFTAQALTQLREENSGAPYIFNMKLDTHTVHTLLNGLRPSSWEVHLESSHVKYSKSLVCHISQNPLIKFGLDFEELLDDSEKDDRLDDHEQYHCCFFTTVKDKLFL